MILSKFGYFLEKRNCRCNIVPGSPNDTILKIFNNQSNHSLEKFSNGDTVDGFKIEVYVKGSSQREQ